MRDCIIFGAGKYGDQAYNLLNGKYRIRAYVDNDEQKHNTKYNGITVCAPDAIESFGDCDVVIAVRLPNPIVEQLITQGIKNPVYIFDPPVRQNAQYLLYRVQDGNICVPEYMDFRYSVDETMRCHYSGLHKGVLRLFYTALGWIKSAFPCDTRIIELGCGSGQFANMLFDHGYTNYIGYDFSSVAIQRAAELNPAKKDCFCQCDIRTVDYSSIDRGVIIAFEVLEHLADDMEIIKKLPKGSTVLLSVPNFDSFNHIRKFNGLTDIVNRYGEYIEFSSYRRIDSNNNSCWFLLQGDICK